MLRRSFPIPFMALQDTILALDCVRPCDTLRDLDDAAFFALLIDALSTASGIDIGDITGAQLTTAVDDALCDLQDRFVFQQTNPQVLKAVALYLAANVGGAED
jgi:hypothetical protein